MTSSRRPPAQGFRRLLRALSVTGAAVGLLASVVLPGGVGTARAASAPLKAAIIVGPTGSLTATYKSSADAVAAAALADGMSVTKVYTPNATWAAVQAATSGANLVYFAGHGNGYPNPYPPGYLQPGVNDGYGLDPSSNGDTPTYYGEQYVAQVKLAPGAIVLLNHLCYAPGASEPGRPVPSQGVAVQRVDNFAAGFLAAGASAVFATDGGSYPALVNGLFRASAATTMDQLFEAYGFNGGSDGYFPSSRTPGASIHLDPESGGLVYTHAVTGNLGFTVGGWRTGQPARQPAPSCPARTTMPPLTATDDRFVAVAPTRVLDTRSGVGLSGPFLAGVPRTLVVAGAPGSGVPAGAAAVSGNLTVTGQTDAGYLAITPTAAPCPATSTLNFPLGDNRANGATVPLASDGSLSITYIGPYADSSTSVVLDVTGYFLSGTSGATYHPLAGPLRIVDSRVGLNLPTRLTSGVPQAFQVAAFGADGIPSGATAITGNLTVTGQTALGYIALQTTGAMPPTTSSLNFPLGDDRANGVTAPLGAGGKLWAVYQAAAGATAQLVFDVTGYFTADATGQTFTPLAPTRVLDTRSGLGLSGAFAAGVPRTLPVAGASGSGVPAGATAVIVNLTVTRQTSLGYLAVTTGPNAAPTTSTLNFPLGDNRANGAIVPLAPDGSLSIVYAAPTGATTDVVLDLTGFTR